MGTQPIAFDSWMIDYHETMAAILKANKAVNAGTFALETAFFLLSASRRMGSLVDRLERLSSIPPSEIHGLLENLKGLRESNVDVLAAVGRLGFWTRLLPNGTARVFRLSAERVQDYLERIELSLDPSVEEDARSAMEEHRRGETVRLESIVSRG